MLERPLQCAILTTSTLFAAAPASAQEIAPMSSQIAQLQQQLWTLQQQMQLLQREISDASRQEAQQQQQYEVLRQSPPQVLGGTPVMRTSPPNRPGICTEDGENCIELTSRVQFDVADYLSVKPQSPAGPHSLTSGVNARRARIGVLGKFFNDWHYTLIADFGGSTDSGNASVIENAFLSYQGLEPFAFEAGYMDLRWTLEQAQSSDDILFLERASVGVIAKNLAAGDFRAAAGIRANDDRYWLGAYATGPRSGALHTGSDEQQLGAIGRAAYQVLRSNEYSLHAGVDYEHVFTPRANGSSTTSISNTLTFSDRPELRVDPTTFLTTGALPAKSADVYGVELAGGYRSLFVQGEYYHFCVDPAGQTATAPKPQLDFRGGYVEASWTLTGEHRAYLPETGAYGGIRPARPLSLSTGGWGAWEVAARWSYVDLNSNATPGRAQSTTGGVFGGRQTVYTLGVNWYPVSNVRLMLDYIHAEVNKLSANGVTPAGVTMDAIAARTQVAF